MNTRKNIDYSSLYTGIDKVIAADLPQMELYWELGRLVSGRPEKGAAVMAAEYICAHYPDRTGFSPRNLRRMRDFYRMYEGYPEILAQAMKIGWTQNIVILEADLEMESRFWYIRAAYQFGWSKMELSNKICECAHKSISLDRTTESCYSSGKEGEKGGKKEETSGTFLQGLWNEKAQREFQRQGSCGAYLQSLCQTLTGAAGRTYDTSPFGKPAAPPPDRERDDMAEKPDPRFQARGEVLGLYSLCGAFSAFGTKSEKAGTVHSDIRVEHRWRGLRSLWRFVVCQRELSGQQKTAGYCSYTGGWRTADKKASSQGPVKAAEMDRAHTGGLLVGRRSLGLRRCRAG